MKPRNYFEEVCGLLESGFTVCEAIDELGLDSKKFYAGLIQEQRLMLKKLRATNSFYGEGNGNVEIKELQEFFTTEYI